MAIADAPRIGVVTFPGTCDDRDALRAATLCGGIAVPLWHGDDDLRGVDGVILPGGFSYGDYLRPGAIGRFAPIMSAVARFADDGRPVLGICNGFQVLCEAGLLPGVLRGNHSGRFICADVGLVVERRSPWLAGRAVGDVLQIPIKHHDGAWYVPADELETLDAGGQILLRYETPVNGASSDVAGVANARGNVFGLMPHPEHAVDSLLGSSDGRAVLEGLVAAASGVLASAPVGC